MSLKTGENEHGLKKIKDLTTGSGVIILLLHFYYYGYGLFYAAGWSTALSDRLLANIANTGLFTPFHKAKIIAVCAFALALIGTKGRKNEKARLRSAILFIMVGLLMYFGSAQVSKFSFDLNISFVAYIFLTLIGLLLFLQGGALIARLIKVSLDHTVFNEENETFPQEERLLENEYSVHFDTRYKLKKQMRAGRINLVAPFRGTLVVGNPGSGKTRWFVKPMIEQFIAKGYAMVLYDFKHPDLTSVAYNAFLKYKNRYKVEPEFIEISFDHPSVRCNPLMPETLNDIADASEAARTLLLALNQDWITKHGDFWVESAISFFTAIIWYLRKYQDGQFCTLPHAIELLQTDYDKLFSILRTESSIEPLVKPFINAYFNAPKMLEGMMASLTVSLGKLSSENLYYVMSGNDISLNVADPIQPKVLSLASNPQKVNVYGAVVSLYLTAIKRSALEQHRQPMCLILEEFASLYFSGIDRFLAYCRSYLIAVVMVVQDLSQLNLYYGKEQANVIMNISGNVISGQTTGETAEQLARRFGKIMQDKQSITVNSGDTSLNKSKFLDFALPASTIGALSSGEFCGIVADNPDQKMKLKKFHGSVMLKEEMSLDTYQKRSQTVTNQQKSDCYERVKKEVKQLVILQLAKMMNTPTLINLIIGRKQM